MVSARWRGSSASGASGRPCATSQNGQRRVQMSPRIMKVAVPLPKHSAMFGQEASSQTVWRFCSRKMRLMSWKREFGLAARTRIHAGFANASRGTILIVFCAPLCFTPASRMVQIFLQGFHQISFHPGEVLCKTQILDLCHLQPGIAARVDRVERGEIHVHVQGEAVVRTAA